MSTSYARTVHRAAGRLLVALVIAAAITAVGRLSTFEFGTVHAAAPDERPAADGSDISGDDEAASSSSLGRLVPDGSGTWETPGDVADEAAAVPRLRAGVLGPDTGHGAEADALGETADTPDQGIVGGEDDILTITTTKGPCGPSLTFDDGELAYFRFQSKQAGPLDIYYAGPLGETHFTRIDLPANTPYRYTPRIDASAGGARMVVRMIQSANRAHAYCSFTVEASVSALCAWSTSMFAECGSRIYETEFESCATGRTYWYEGEVFEEVDGAAGPMIRSGDATRVGTVGDVAPGGPESEIPSLWSFEGPRVAWDPDCYTYVLTGYSRVRLIGFAPSVSCSDCPSTRDHGGTINVWTQRGSFYQCDGVFQRGETVRIYVRAGQSGTASLTIRHSDDTRSTISLGSLVAGITYIGDLVVDDEPSGRQVMYVQQPGNRAFDSCSYIVDSPRMCTTVGSLIVDTIPVEPVAGEPFTIRVSGTALDGCVPGGLSARLRSGIVELDLAWGGCGRSCGGGPTSWAREVVMTIPYVDVFPATVSMSCSGRGEVCDDGVITVKEAAPPHPGCSMDTLDGRMDLLAGELAGIVRNGATGAAIPGATVRINGPDVPSAIATSDDRGVYSFGGLEPGSYILWAQSGDGSTHELFRREGVRVVDLTCNVQDVDLGFYPLMLVPPVHESLVKVASYFDHEYPTVWGRSFGGITWPADAGGVGDSLVPFWSTTRYPSATLWDTGGGSSDPFDPDFGIAYSGHNAIDLARRNPEHSLEGIPVRPAAKGTLRIPTPDSSGYGNHVIIDHGDGYETLYAHLHEVIAAPGPVDLPDVIGSVGRSGTDGVHLHLEVRQSGIPVDPLGWLPSPDKDPWVKAGAPKSRWMFKNSSIANVTNTFPDESGAAGLTSSDSLVDVEVPSSAFEIGLGRVTLVHVPPSEGEPAEGDALLRHAGTDGVSGREDFRVVPAPVMLDLFILSAIDLDGQDIDEAASRPLTLAARILRSDLSDDVDLSSVRMMRWDTDRGEWAPLGTRLSEDASSVTARASTYHVTAFAVFANRRGVSIFLPALVRH